MALWESGHFYPFFVLEPAVTMRMAHSWDVFGGHGCYEEIDGMIYINPKYEFDGCSVTKKLK